MIVLLETRLAGDKFSLFQCHRKTVYAYERIGWRA